MKIYIGLGSNLGDRAAHLLFGVRGLLEAGLHVARLSSIYETEPVDLIEQPPFLNMVAEIDESNFSPEQLLARLLRIEYALGRRRERVRGPRNIDLDLLLYGDFEHADDFLTLPHPRLHLRRFVLVPLVELAPQALHPTLRQTFSELLANLSDEACVKLWRPD